MQGDGKSSNILWKSCDAHTARFLNYVWPFFIIIQEKISGNNECSTLSEGDLDNYYHKALHLGCCNSLRSASVCDLFGANGRLV